MFESTSRAADAAPRVGARRHRWIGLAALVLAALGTAYAASPAGAEISSTPTTTWGVSGLQAGTETGSISSAVFAIEQIGNTVYVGGRFTTATNGTLSESQPGIAAFNATTGAFISTWRPQLNGAVYAIQASADGSRLFVGGDFDTVNGTATGALVALNPTTGAIDTGWTGRVGGYQLVRSIDLGHGYVYAAGGFTSIRSTGASRSAYRAARFAESNGAIDPNWLPVISGGSVWGIAASPNTDRVYLAGYFNSSNFTFAQQGFTAISSIDGSNVQGLQPLAFNTTNSSRRYLYDVEVAGNYVWVGGSEHFVQVLNESNLSLHKFHLSGPNNGDFQDLEVVGNRVYAGCHCRPTQSISTGDGVLWFANQGPSAPSTNTGPTTWISAYNVTTGLRESSFNPTITSGGAGIWAIHGSPDGCLWLGGSLTTSGGVTQRNVSRLCDAANPTDTQAPTTPGAPQITGQTTNSVSFTWNPSTDNVGVSGYRIYDNATNAVVLDSPTNSGTVANLAAGTYSFYARAYDAVGNLSTRSGLRTVTITAVVVDTTRPSTPSGLKLVSLSGSTASFSWNASTDNVGVAGYRLFDAAGTQLTEVTGTSATLTGLAPGSYVVSVRAFDAAGNVSYRSNTVTITVL